MSADSSVHVTVHPGLIWGLDAHESQTRPLDDADIVCERFHPAAFRWLHLSLADQPTRRWIASASPLPPKVRELLLNGEGRPHAVAEDGVLGFVLQDIERDFDDGETRVGRLRFAIGPSLMVTARQHPLRSADIVKERIGGGARVCDAAAAFDQLLGSMAEAAHRELVELEATVQAVEDDLLDGGRPPDGRSFVVLRLVMVRLHRMLSGNRAVLHGLDDEGVLPPDLAAVAVKSMERLAALDAELLALQGQLRLLREELDAQATQRTNQNLYILSILTALMLPATLVTGIFGMNTGGLPWAMTPAGTLMATALAVGSAAAVYLVLRVKGFIQR